MSELERINNYKVWYQIDIGIWFLFVFGFFLWMKLLLKEISPKCCSDIVLALRWEFLFYYFICNCF